MMIQISSACVIQWRCLQMALLPEPIRIELNFTKSLQLQLNYEALIFRLEYYYYNYLKDFE